MTAEAQHEYDRSSWGPGPWESEPDRVDFEHGGLPCLLLRSPMGFWCGYAAVLPGHPWHGVDSCQCLAPADPAHASDENGWHECEQRPESLMDVHGGLTYSGACSGSICHVPKPGEPDAVWWFGFDCGHAFDLTPGMRAFRVRYRGAVPYGEVYRDLAYAREQTERRAEQLAAARA